MTTQTKKVVAKCILGAFYLGLATALVALFIDSWRKFGIVHALTWGIACTGIPLAIGWAMKQVLS